MVDPRTGGPAFPTDRSNDPSYTDIGGGMTLRDYFAAAALPEAFRQEATGDSGLPCIYDSAAVARVAYTVADAMIAERDK